MGYKVDVILLIFKYLPKFKEENNHDFNRKSGPRDIQGK